MSSYVNFYIKDVNRNVSVYLNSYSRSSKIYGIFRDEAGENRLADEHAAQLQLWKIRNMIDAAKALRDSDQAYLQRIKNACEMFLNSNSSVEDKYEYIGSFQEQQVEIEEDIAELESAIWFFNFLANIQYSDKADFIYAGIDACNPDGSDDEEGTQAYDFISQ